MQILSDLKQARARVLQLLPDPHHSTEQLETAFRRADMDRSGELDFDEVGSGCLLDFLLFSFSLSFVFLSFFLSCFVFRPSIRPSLHIVLRVSRRP